MKILQNKKIWMFLAIFSVAIFLRTYHFSDWLHFELDQARDATLIKEAIDGGAGELPLLGPRAAGTFLRLGPASYYLEYLSTKLFSSNNIPLGMAMSILFFALLALPIFYLLMKRYFSLRISLGLTAIFASSIFLITYARFTWNPNLLPFFIIAFLWGLLKSVDCSEKKSGWWLVFSAGIFGILMQLHFVALIILALTAGIFLLYKRPRWSIKFWLLAIVLVLLLNIPMLINEYKTGGENSRQFVSAVFKKSEKDTHTFSEKIAKNFTEHSLRYWLVLSGSQSGELPALRVDKNNEFDIRCDKFCRENLPIGGLTAIFFVLGIMLLGREIFKEKNVSRKDFLVLHFILFLASFIIFIPLSFSLSPRFFLIPLVLPFIWLGLLLKNINLTTSNKRKSINLIISVFIIANLFFVYRYFFELSLAKTDNIIIGRDRILKQKTRITLEQQKIIVDYLEKFYRQNKYPIFYHGQSEFHRAFAYLLDGRKIPRDGISKQKICRQGNYFLIIRTQSEREKFNSYWERFSVLEKKSFGTLTVFHLKPRHKFVNCEKPDTTKFRNYKGESGAVAKRYKWKEL